MIRLTRLRIDRFRNVKPGTDLRFGPTFNVLLGKNATGKSTLLDLIAAVTNGDLSTYAKEDAGFDLTWWLEKGEDEVEVRAVRTPVRSVTLLEEVREGKEFDDVWTLVIRTAKAEVGRIEVTGTRGTWKPRGEPEVPFDVRIGLVEGGGMAALAPIYVRYITPSEPKTLPVLTSILAAIGILGVHGHVRRFDEAAATLDTITRSSFEVRRQGADLAAWHSPWLPNAFYKAVRALAPSDALVISFDNLGSLAQVPALLGFTSAEIRPRVLKRSQDGEMVATTYQGFDCLFRRASGSWISHELLSFGQKRLFSFLWYFAVRDELPIVADELLNGLHHEWIEVCFDRLRDRQSFLATQHPFLLDHIPIESADRVRTTFVRCAVERDPHDGDCLAWRNFDEEEAERFFIAYQTGIQQVNEVLRTEGLW